MIVSVIAGIVELLAAYIIGNKQKIGWLLEIVADIIWIYLGWVHKEIIGVWIICFPDLIISTRNYLKWEKEEKETTTNNMASNPF